MPLDYVFASGEAPDADAAYALAQRNLWDKLQQLGLADAVKGIEHEVTTRESVARGLDIEAWEVSERRVANVIVTLLATVIRTEKGTKN